MRAVVYTGAGGHEVVQLRDVPAPEPGLNQVRVRIKAAGLNRADVYQRRGHYPAPPGSPPDIPGLEYAGEVEALGTDSSRWNIGDRVMGLVGGGTHAEYVVAHQDEILPVPVQLEFTQAAAIPEAFFTAYDALVTRARLARGERVLIHAVGSGIGTAAIQIARLLGAHSLGTSRTPEKLARAKELGLETAISTATAGFRDQVGEPVNVIIDVLGGPAWADNLAVLAPLGRMVVLAFLQGPQISTDFTPLLRKRLEILGSVMRTRPPQERVGVVAAFRRDMLPHFATGELKPVVGSVLPMTEISAAHQAMETNETFGKLVLVW
ncbi:MAG TPA: NAD(P)H-quinone oxidoreductase [Gemmatimonadales bacterium]|nr:NAD(P)H-quinone oxidoreductase [Gemmatimonadales bacterium]